MKFAHMIVAASLALVAGNALANEKKPNCEVKGQAKHVADKAACDKEHGKWLEADAKAAKPADAAKPAEAKKP